VFIGHVAAGLAAKRVAPRASTAVLLGAPLLLDLIWPKLLLLGVERVEIDPGNTAYTPLDFTHYPYSHSLLLVTLLALLAAAAYGTVTKYRRGALVVGVLVLSHWVFDWIVHRPDLPLYPGGPLAGLGLWHSIPGTIAVEAGLYVAGIMLFLSATRPTSVQGRVSFWSLIALLAVISVGNLLGPPPPGSEAIAAVGFALWLIPLWGIWIDRHREARI
jgi:hypothetical protein